MIHRLHGSPGGIRLLPIFLLLTFSLIGIESLHAQLLVRVKGSMFDNQKVTAYGCGWIDYDGDGFLDILINNPFSQSSLCRNLGDGTFSAVTEAGVPPTGGLTGITWGDYDNDGRPDLFLTPMSGPGKLFRNLGGGKFSPMPSGPWSAETGTFLHCTWVDYDNDGWLDLFVPSVSSLGFTASAGTRNLLFHNNGDGTFSRVVTGPIASDLGNNCCGVFGDLNNDGCQDLFLTEWQRPNWLYLNNGDGTFSSSQGNSVNENTEVSLAASWGDYDNDGNLDLFVGNGFVNPVSAKSWLYHGNGDGTFNRVTTGPVADHQGCTWNGLWEDIDNDGNLDLFVGTIYGPDAVFLNNGDGTFRTGSVLDTSSGGTSGASFGDYDNDGFMDLFTTNAGGTGNFLYHNQGNGNHWLTVSCTGTVSNRSALGTRVKLKATIGGKPVWQMREITGNQGFRSVQDLRAHFGLGDAATVDSLVVIWPSGIRTVRTLLPANQFVAVSEQIPAGFVKALPAGDTTTGRGYLTVHFMDRSIADTAHPVTLWSWDFDGDGITDSHEQNPVHTYVSEGGNFTVGLTVSNGLQTSTQVRKDFIQMFSVDLSDIAFRKHAFASSSTLGSPNAVTDGDVATEWRSLLNQDSQWVMVDLDSVFSGVNKVVLHWGGAYGKDYTVEAATDTAQWSAVAQITNGDGGTDEIFFAAVQARYIRVSATRRSGRWYALSELEVYVDAVSGIRQTGSHPPGFLLNQNYPNPFNPSTTITYALPQAARVALDVFTILGQKVKTLVSGTVAPGTHAVTWDGRDDLGRLLACGVYIYCCRIGTPGRLSVAAKKMILLP